MSGSQNAFSDADFSNFTNASYYVEGVMTSGVCQVTDRSTIITGAKSNISHTGNTLGIKDNGKLQISIYPNPANDIIYVTLPDASIDKNTCIEIYNAIGQLVLIQKTVSAKTSIKINSLAKGIYSVKVISNNKQMVNRIFKN